MQLFGQTGPNGPVGDGVQVPFRQGRYADQIVSELQGRFYEACYRGMLFSNGCSLTALTANTITLTNTTTPILGLWNPSTSTVNAVVLQAALDITINNLTNGAGPGAFVWATSIGNTVAPTTGVKGFSRKALATAGSQVQGMSFAALTGITNNLVVLEGADFPAPSGLTYGTFPATAVIPVYNGVQNFDGNLIVPPGGILALLNTVSSTLWSVAGRLLWAEVNI